MGADPGRTATDFDFVETLLATVGVRSEVPVVLAADC